MNPMMWLLHNAVRYPRYWLLGGILTTICLATGIAKLELKTNGAALYPEENAIIEQSEADRLRFGEPRHVVVLVGCSEPECLATPEGFRFLRRVQLEIESLSAVRGDDVQSIASLLRVERQADRLSLERYLDRVPEGGPAFSSLLAAIRAYPLTDGLLLSADARLASFFVPLAEHRPVVDLVRELEFWLDHFDHEGFDLQLTGPELAEATLGEMVLRDLGVLVPVMLVVVSILLYLTFGSVGGVMIPMLEAGIVMLWTFGAMGWLGIPVTLVTTILPVVLMAMAITDEIHLLERLAAQDPSLSREEAVLAALEQVGRPIIITSVTTALGFLSFLSASIQPIREFGLFTGFGILVAMLLTFTWIPAMIVLLPESYTRRRDQTWSLPKLGLEALAQSGIRRPTFALGAGLVLILMVVPGVLSLRVQDSWVDNFDPQASIARADRAFNSAFWGSYRYDVVFDALPGFFYSAAGTRLIEDFETVANDIPEVGGVESYTIPLSHIASAIGEKPRLSELPALAVSDLAILAEMSSARATLRQLLTDAGDAARVRLYVNAPNYAKSVALREALQKTLAEFSTPEFVSVHSSGDLPVAIEVVGQIVANQMRSIAWALGSVAIVLIVFFGGWQRGLVAMVPVIAATFFVFGAMGYLGVPLGIATSMFASLTVGVGVDFGIHFLHGYQSEREAGANDAEALSATARKAGTALRWNALVLALGFAVLSVSDLKPNHSLGFLLAAAMLACYVATLLFLPRLCRFATLAGLGVTLFVAAPPVANADAPDCGTKQDPRARAIMAGIESDIRSGTRVVHMRIHPNSFDRQVSSDDSAVSRDVKSLWSVIESDEYETRSLYVFSSPGRLAGTTLLLRDRIGTLDGDMMWIYLRGFDSFTRIESTARRRTVVPGTALTYEDAKGFISIDKYRFSFARPLSKGIAEIVACPLTPALSSDLGYGRLVLRVDHEKRLVLAVDYQDLAGRTFKQYRLEQEQRVDTRWLPKRVLLEHLAKGTRVAIEYAYWFPDRAPPEDLFVPSIDAESFRTRILRYLSSLELDELIRAELSDADARVRRWEEKWGSRAPESQGRD